MPTENEKFSLDPITYVKMVCVNLQTGGGISAVGAFNANNAYAPAYFDQAPWAKPLFGSPSQVMLDGKNAYAAGLIQGYYVPYIAYGTITSNNADMVPLWDVPASAPPYRFIFTGGQNGCSLLLLTGRTNDTVCALHYPNSDGKKVDYPLLARIGKTKVDIILAIDFDLYGEDDNPNACSFFFYNGTEWIGITQPQIQGGPDMKWRRPSMSINRAKGVRKVSKNSAGSA